MKTKIYKITNNVNDKIYVGKTSGSIEDRLKIHFQDSKSRKLELRPLYRAINKYGKSNFYISLIEECDSSIENDREKYWIEYYNGYSEGYNATIGGEGSTVYDHQQILDLLLLNISVEDICRLVGCCKDVVRKIAKNNNVDIVLTQNSYKRKIIDQSIPVKQFDLSGKFLNLFNSYADAVRWLYDKNIIKTISGGARLHIGEVCAGKRKTAYGFQWSKVNS